MAVNEETPLLRASRQDKQKTKADGERDKLAVYGSFLGVFLAAADESIVLSTWSVIASEFHRLSQGSWLLAAYNFGWCVSLPVYGTLCDIYGRKNVLVSAYALFAAGCLACGASTSMVQLVLARVLTGASAGGMVSLVSVVLTDMVPADEVALLRSYANVVNVVGRSIGAPLGGYIIGAVGWRWSFIGQLPVAAICLLIGLYGLPSSLNSTKTRDADEGTSRRSIMGLDFAGLVSFSVTILLLLLLMQELSAPSDRFQIPLTILAPAVCAGVILFIVIEAYWARTPLIPLHLLKTSLGGFCLNQILMMSSRSGLMSNLAPYLIRVKGASSSLAASAFVLAAVGVSIGALIAGKVIKRSKRYRTMTVIAVCGAFMTYLLIFIRWRNGCYLWELVYLLPNGMAIGILFTTQFIGMSLGVPSESLTTCITTYYLAQQSGNIIGPAANVAVVQRIFMGRLEKNLNQWDEKKFIGQILNDDRFAQNLSPAVQYIVRWSYLNAFQLVPLISAACALFMLPTVLWVKEESLLD
ncbi:major facilitator superfamily domain-containing protein [Aspergillus pseudonomiae]|uniref:Major facilitator superfamily domain-containing protein n=1 Tax=Aspergillus pseudonomiae TaxID=1506151 RepID=A0A5N6IIY7_9EURO|nr:major facilitator superfamily domain-containing protein [Aspergillus pseudonomiae]KAB8265073.1 major facilitator superfamily domain-containing protein [Aspergillus pseudonomiae]KAE8397877.1 major facilitator superfamily domain-containing protein [Aspergillus pseudonomiae]